MCPERQHVKKSLESVTASNKSTMERDAVGRRIIVAQVDAGQKDLQRSSRGECPNPCALI